MPNDRFFKELANKSSKPKPGSHLDQMIAGWKETYPIGAVRKVLKYVIDPLKDKTLSAGSLVTIKSYELDLHDAKQGPRWVVCVDPNNEEWNVPRTYLVKISSESEKRGRFRILAQDAEMENYVTPQ